MPILTCAVGGAGSTDVSASIAIAATNKRIALAKRILPSARSSFLIFWRCGRSELHGPSDDFRPTILPCVCHCSHGVMPVETQQERSMPNLTYVLTGLSLRSGPRCCRISNLVITATSASHPFVRPLHRLHIYFGSDMP